MDAITFTNGQAQANSKLDRFLESDDSFFLLTGSAGTGKTFLLSIVYGKVKQGRMVGTAPTHKACAVLATRLPDVPVMTIHRFLGLRPKRTKDTTVLTRRNDYDPSAHMDVRVVVLDEGSMAGEDIKKYILEDAETWGRKYIVVGDAYQLNPVNEKVCPMFQIDYGPHQQELTEIVRQAADNPIIKAATVIREAIRAGREPEVLAGHTDNLGVYMLRRADWERKIGEHVDNHDPDSFRIIAYKNDKVREYNQLVRNMLNLDIEVPFSEGEWVVVNEAFMQDEEVVLNTGLEFQVVGMTPITHPVYEDLTGWFVTVEDSKGEIAEVPVLDYANCGDAYKGRLQKLADNAKQFNDWRPYYRLAEFFCDLRPLYSITSHKSQGSTFDNGFVDLRDIYSNRNLAEADRCLYVALTRFRYNVYVLV